MIPMTEIQLDINFERVPSLQWRAERLKREKAKPAATIDSRFESWLANNDAFYRAFVAEAIRLRRSGEKRASPDGIAHWLRHQLWKKRTPVKHWSDHYVRCLSRKAMAEFPIIDGLFETRVIKATR
jgi:hypothetical protein